MSNGVRSRTPSRSGTPAPSTRSPSRLLIPPALRSAPSFSSLRSMPSTSHTAAAAIGSNLSSNVVSSSQSLDSSASSVIDVDVSEGILVQDVYAEVDAVDGDEGMAIGRLDTQAGDEESKKTLRDQLRRTLSNRPSNQETRVHRTHNHADIQEMSHEGGSLYPPREYIVLTDAGKPVFTSRPEADDITATIGITQALISVFLDDGDKLRCINAGNTRITFLLRPPLYYVCVSAWKEPESVTRSHLEYLHLQILSVVTGAQLRRIFERRTNFDLRRLLNGAEPFLHSLLGRLEFDLALSTSSLHALRLDASLRSRVAESLVPPSKMKDILYVILVARGRVITLIRPKKHSIHPADIHILLNTIHAPSIINSPASASWIPVCLPKFNPSGFVNAYISFLRKPDDAQNDETEESGASSGHEREAGGVALVCISGGGDFETIRGWCDIVTQKLDADGALDGITRALRTGATEYSISELGIPGLRHFLYKSRPQVQITAPAFEEPYDDLTERRRIVTLYQILHDAIHAKSGQGGTLKLQYIRTEHESVMGWITQPFELYIALSPRLPKSAAVNAANAVARWVKKEEGRLFLRDAPVF